MSAANRNRGARAEVAVVNYLRANGWPDARRYLAGDGRQPGDIDFHPLVCLEVKDRAGSAWPTWCRQTKVEARDGLVPVVVRRTRGVPNVGDWPCRVRFADWIDAVDFDSAWGLGIASEMVDGYAWQIQPFAAFVAALHAFDCSDQAAL